MQTHTPDLAFVPNPRSVAAARTRIGSRRRQFQGAGYAIVGLVALGLGVGGTLLYQRNQQPGVPPVTESDHAGHAVDGEPDSGATRGGAVFISPARQRLIGVRTTEATHQTVERGIRTVGTLAVDETRQAQVHTKIAGWAEQVTADFVGKPVRKGQALFTIYSPELVATQKEYLLALRARREFADSEFAETRESSERW